jgi:F-type H+-transporting ATPase subunit b
MAALLFPLLLRIATVAQAAEGAEGAAGAHEGGVPWSTVGFQTMTLIVFVGVLYFVARRPVGDALKDRALRIKNQIEETSRLKTEAKARHDEIEARLASLDQRVTAMRGEAEADAAREAERIRERAQADAARIRETAERTIREEAARARNELRNEAVQLSIRLAGDALQRAITPADQDRLAREFLAAVDEDAKKSPAPGTNNGHGGPSHG